VDFDAKLADGWTLRRVVGPSRLYGANGLRTGADGRIYIAQVAGSQVSAIDVTTGEIEVISPMGGNVIAPDDLAFDEAGNLFFTEITKGRISVREKAGRYRIIQGDINCANPITLHQGHLYTGECIPGGRIMELDRNGGAPRIILENVPMPNAFEIGPDGKLYFPVMGANEIWRVDPAGGEPEVVARDLGVPDSVKFDSEGFIVSTQVASGQVLRIDPRTGSKTVLAQLRPGLDNCTFVGDRLFVSSMTGEIVEILAPGKTRPLVEKGLQWPMGLAVADNGDLYIADGAFIFRLVAGGEPEMVGNLFSPGYPGFARGLAAIGEGELLVTTANGDVARFWPEKQQSEMLASGYDQPMGVVTNSDGTVLFAAYGSGQVMAVENGNITALAGGLDRPVGLALSPDGSCYVSESGAGRILKLTGHKAETVLDDLRQPEGVVFCNGKLYIIDAVARELIQFDPGTGVRESIASNLPVGGPPGVDRHKLGPIGTLAGPMTAFTGIAAGSDGTIYIAGDAEGSVLCLR